ncbi:hypothetical protein WH47_12656 [Habropoda laboriosa]|uniref:Uncharacterized protein n=1 Tax=Habropoda laboriosa TaxID=597456 RepID=A0A0L7QKB3_9HYME|nr:hypothetical protein WH47_12656 [Habropoda laboriosa]
MMNCRVRCNILEALAVDNAWAGLVVFLLGDPHLLESGQGSQNGSTDPYRVLSLRGRNDLDLDGRWSQGGNFLLHTIGNTRVHGSTTRQYSISIQVLTDIDIALHDGVVHGLVDTTGFHTQEGWLEESFRATEPLVTDGDDLSIRQLVALLKRGASCGSGHFLFKVQGDVAKFFLDVADNFSLSRGGEAITSPEWIHRSIRSISSQEVR